MRRLMQRLRRETGASAVLVAVLLVPIMGFTAVAVDVGMLYYERAQLQHAADSAAMAVATKCSVSNCPSTTTLAGSFASDNVKDGAVTIASQNINVAARTVTIDVTTLNADKTTAINHPFAAAAGFDVTSTTVFATATAQWAQGSATLPLALTTCEFNISDAASGQSRWVSYDTNKKCKGDPLEPEVPGGFGWLDLQYEPGSKKTPVGCIAEIAADGTAGSEPGNNGLPNEKIEDEKVCHSTFTESLAGQIVYVPLADSADETGSKAIWHIKEYGKFVIHAWNFSGGKETKLPDMYKPDMADAAGETCLKSCNGVLVEFKGYAAIGTVPGSDISTSIALIE